MSFVRVRLHADASAFVRLPLASSTTRDLADRLIASVGVAAIRALAPEPDPEHERHPEAAAAAWGAASQEGDTARLVDDLRFARVSAEGSVFHLGTTVTVTSGPAPAAASTGEAGASTTAVTAATTKRPLVPQTTLAQLGVEHCQLLVLQRRGADGTWCFLRAPTTM
jgi:hypothetical protein